ncbi:T9SS type A sorting domain-containing protein [Faecalibacter rhinopitheci]|uniref:T9SS type A sorting domain-containing protein n=1 Tax=Faecalibacter rhinopitheci TaxID=2779678 RepID=A0A8J7G7D1_9FLAO|nr:T9SS type A sorting domain-containing protein [Faecalibacter rhinopitheci]MBF0598187.1 T9SS type A sorting domain-containing protein [Faecalibacter rhinopitheci]
MNKKLLFVSTLFLLMTGNIKAQSKISFEEEENYYLGSIKTQNGWEIYSDVEDNIEIPEILVTNAQFTDGKNSLKIETKDSNIFIGAFKNITASAEKIKVSMDVFVEDIYKNGYGSEIMLTLIDQNDTNLATINLAFDNTVWTGSGSYVYEVEGVTYASNSWLTISYQIDFENSNINFYLNDTYISSQEIEMGASLTALDVYMFDMGTQFYVDNISIESLLETSSISSQQKKIEIFPNPVSDILNIKTKDDIKVIEVYDISGKKLITTTDKVLNVHSLPKGSYVVKIITDKETTVKKFIKK